MCMSPHQMTSARIEESINYYRSYAEKESTSASNARWAQGLIENLERVLKERAEDGTYDTAGHKPGDRNETQRTEYQNA
jgi:hypothetical protein